MIRHFSPNRRPTPYSSAGSNRHGSTFSRTEVRTGYNRTESFDVYERSIEPPNSSMQSRRYPNETPTRSQDSRVVDKSLERLRRYQSREDEDCVIEPEDLRVEPEELRVYDGPSERGANGMASDKESCQLKRKRGFASVDSHWLPVQMIQNYCFDKDSGVLFDRDTCKKNLDAAMSKKKDVDFYDILRTTASKEGYALAYALYMIDKLSKKPPKSEATDPVTVFDLNCAVETDRETLLPGGRRLLLSKIVKPSECARWHGKQLFSKAVIHILDEIRVRDPYFLIFSAADLHRKTLYPALTSDFFDAFSKFIMSGMKMPNSPNSMVTITGRIQISTRNYIEHRRSSNKNLVDKLLRDFLEQVAKNPAFRSSEPPLHETDSLVCVRFRQESLDAHGGEPELVGIGDEGDSAPHSTGDDSEPTEITASVIEKKPCVTDRKNDFGISEEKEQLVKKRKTTHRPKRAVQNPIKSTPAPKETRSPAPKEARSPAPKEARLRKAPNRFNS